MRSLTQETYIIEGSNKVLTEKQNLVFTKNGHVKFSETFNGENSLIETTEKKIWFIKQSFSDKEAYYCKTRWKPKSKERISCYSQKKYKKNEAIYHYNSNGTIHKIVDNFTNFHTRFYIYNSKSELIHISIKDKEGILIDDIVVSCKSKDYEGTCIKIHKVSSKTNQITEIIRRPTY